MKAVSLQAPEDDIWTPYRRLVGRVNDSKIRNQFGEVLDMLEKGREPILIEKKKKIKAVLISYEDYLNRFIDKQAEEEKKKFIATILSHRERSTIPRSPLETLRRLRGYSD